MPKRVMRRKRRNFRKRSAPVGVRLAKVERQVRANKDVRYTDKVVIDDDAVSTSGTIVYSVPVPTRGDNFRAQRASDVIHIFRQEYYINCVGSENNVIFTTDFWNHIGIKIGYVLTNDGSASLPSVVGSAASLWDTGIFGAGNFLASLPEGPTPGIKWKIQARRVVPLAGLSAASDSTNGQVFVRDHVKQFKIVLTYKRPMTVKFFSSDTDTLATYSTRVPFFACISDSSATPSPSISVACRTWYYA